MTVWIGPLLLGLAAATAQAGPLRVGAAAIVINPPEGTPMAGYYSPRGAKTVIDNLYSKALVLEQDGTQVALVVCDLISLPRHTVVAARKLIEKQTGIPGAHVMISATHTHTGPVVRRDSSRDQLDGGASDLGQRYTEKLPELIAQSVAAARERLTPARMSAAIGKEDYLSFNRRFVMRDQTVGWNPRKQDANIVRPAGPIDPDVSLLLFAGPKAQPMAAYVNFAMHPDTVGGEGVSADYPGVLSQLLAEFLGKELVTVFANGCCGNLNHRNIHWLDAQKGPHEARRIGTVLAGAVCRTYPRLQPVTSAGLKAKSAMVRLPLPPVTDAEVNEAKERLKNIRKIPFLQQVKTYQVLDVVGQKQRPWEVEVQVIAFGDQAAWVSLPGEIFVELGLAIKKASPFPFTMIAELSNGSIGYIPDRPAYAQGNYEVVSARCAEGSGELLIEAATGLLKELHAAQKNAERRP